jgi:hypothetical protein
MSHEWYPGDIIDFGRNTLCAIIRSIDNENFTVQFKHHIFVININETTIRWTGKCITVFPRTEWGWRRIYNRTLGEQK